MGGVTRLPNVAPRIRPQMRRRFPILAAALLALLVWGAYSKSASAIYRKIYDAGDPFNEPPDNPYTAWLGRFSSAYNYTFGREEGRPARGPNPVPGFAYGSTDVDTLYDMMGSINQYYLTKFGRDGANTQGGTGDGSQDFPAT